jgi:hypothetical protein
VHSHLHFFPYSLLSLYCLFISTAVVTPAYNNNFIVNVYFSRAGEVLTFTATSSQLLFSPDTVQITVTGGEIYIVSVVEFVTHEDAVMFSFFSTFDTVSSILFFYFLTPLVLF